MINAVITEVASWLDDPTDGVNATSASMPLDVDELAPPMITVVAETVEGWAARARVTKDQVAKGPLLLVRTHAEASALLFPRPFEPDAATLAAIPNDYTGRVPVAVLYAALGSTTEREVAIARAVLRTVLRVIALRFAAADEYVRAAVTIGRPDVPAHYLTLLDAGDDAVVMLGVMLGFPAHDPWALGA